MQGELASTYVDLRLDDGSDEHDVPVHYLTAGTGSPLILLHGIGIDAGSISWRRALPELSKYHRVYAVDLPGHGRSGKPRLQYTTELYRQTVSAFVDELDIGEHDIAGVSMGGSVALGHALDHPETVNKLGLVASYGLGDDAPWREWVHRTYQFPFLGLLHYSRLGKSKQAVRRHLRKNAVTVPEDLVADVYANAQDGAFARTATTWQRSEIRANGFRTSYVDDLERVSAKTLIVHGIDDTLIPLEWAETANERIPDSQLEVIDACGHWVPRERPEWFNSVFTRFFAGDAAQPEAPGLLRAANRSGAVSN